MSTKIVFLPDSHGGYLIRAEQAGEMIIVGRVIIANDTFKEHIVWFHQETTHHFSHKDLAEIASFMLQLENEKLK